MFRWCYKTNSPLVLILPKMSVYIRKFKDKYKNKNNKLMSFCTEYDKLLKKIKKPFGLTLKT